MKMRMTKPTAVWTAVTFCGLPALTGCVPNDPAQLGGVVTGFITDFLLSAVAALLL